MAFPRRAIGGVAAGFVAIMAAIHLIPFDVTSELPAVAAPVAPRPEIGTLLAKRAENETRIFFCGASLTAGFPYPAPVSYGDQLGFGLAALYPDRKIIAHSHAKPALDSPKLARMVEELVDKHDPSLVCVALGSNEFANRIFSSRNLVPQNGVEWAYEHGSRSRVLYRTLPSGGELESETEIRMSLEKWILEGSRAWKPFFSGLPVPEDDRALLRGRMRESMRRMSATCQRKNVKLVFLVAIYGLAGSWPWGISGGGANAEVDGLVTRFRRKPAAELLPEVDALLAKWPERADLHYMRGMLLRAYSNPSEAKAALERARDLDSVPMHLTGPIQREIVAEAKALGRPCYVLDEVFASLSKDGIQGPEHYLDYGHVDATGHRRIAEWLAKRFIEDGPLADLGKLPAGWSETFRQAAVAGVNHRVLPVQITTAEWGMPGSNGTFAMLFGNYREGVQYWKQSFQIAPLESKLAPFFKLAISTYDLAGRRDELLDGGEAAVGRRSARLFEAAIAADAAGKLDEWIDGILAGK